MLFNITRSFWFLAQIPKKVQFLNFCEKEGVKNPISVQISKKFRCAAENRGKTSL